MKRGGGGWRGGGGSFYGWGQPGGGGGGIRSWRRRVAVLKWIGVDGAGAGVVVFTVTVHPRRVGDGLVVREGRLRTGIKARSPSERREPSSWAKYAMEQ